MNHRIIRGVIAVSVGTALLGTPVAFGQTAESTIQALMEQIVALQKQIMELKAKQNVAVTQLITSLKEGDSGVAVEELQAILEAEGFFANKITGYFGPITKKAVMDFQKEHGIPQVGKVGPMTLEKIKTLSSAGTIGIEESNGVKKACLPPGKLIAPGQAKKGLPNLPPCKDPLPPGIQKLLGQGGPGSGGSGNGTTTPDIFAPIISGLTATSTTATTSAIVWQTNEPATSIVWYGTTTPVVATSTTLMVSSSSLVMSHAMTLSNLTASTTYYYVAVSSDASLNTATSSEQSFMTQ